MCSNENENENEIVKMNQIRCPWASKFYHLNWNGLIEKLQICNGFNVLLADILFFNDIIDSQQWKWLKFMQQLKFYMQIHLFILRPKLFWIYALRSQMDGQVNVRMCKSFNEQPYGCFSCIWLIQIFYFGNFCFQYQYCMSAK